MKLITSILPVRDLQVLLAALDHLGAMDITLANCRKLSSPSELLAGHVAARSVGDALPHVRLEITVEEHRVAAILAVFNALQGRANTASRLVRDSAGVEREAGTVVVTKHLESEEVVF